MKERSLSLIVHEIESAYSQLGIRLNNIIEELERRLDVPTFNDDYETLSEYGPWMSGNPMSGVLDEPFEGWKI